MTLKFKQAKKFSIMKEYPKFPEISMQWTWLYYENDYHFAFLPRLSRTVLNSLLILWLYLAIFLKNCWSIRGLSMFLHKKIGTFRAWREISCELKFFLAWLCFRWGSSYGRSRPIFPQFHWGPSSGGFRLKTSWSSSCCRAYCYQRTFDWSIACWNWN